VNAARLIQEKRLAESALFSNAGMQSRHLKVFCALPAECDRLLEQAVDVLGFSARACHSVIRTARTIADLEHSKNIQRRHLAEAIQYRSFDRILDR
jgi:magnesium chelatase family protein